MPEHTPYEDAYVPGKTLIGDTLALLEARTTALRQAREALRRYGNHHVGCPRLGQMHRTDVACDCGYLEALVTIEAALGEKA